MKRLIDLERFIDPLRILLTREGNYSPMKVIMTRKSDYSSSCPSSPGFRATETMAGLITFESRAYPDL